MNTTETLAAIDKTVVVEVSIETAFETFTRRLASWWPLETHSIHKHRIEQMVFEERVGGRLYERTSAGEEADWGDVLVWEPPERIVLRWRVNPDRAPTEVEVRFTPEGGRTRVDLQHRGWELAGDAEGRAHYDPGWDLVLSRFVAASPS